MSETGQVSEAIGAVESQLAAFWSTPETSGGEPMPKVRASTLNFAVIGAPDSLDDRRAAVDSLSEVYGGRSFLLTVDPRIAPWGLDTDVSAVCRTGGEVPICYDRVEIAFGALAAARAASVIGALSLSEVPLLVEMAAGAPASLVDVLAPRADRLIVDAGHTKVRRIAEVARAVSGPIGDRLFVRTFSWRDLVARFFDAHPEWTRAIRRVEVGVDAGEDDPASFGAPALLVGWLASRLGWRFTSRTGAQTDDGRSVALGVRTDTREGLARGDLVSVRIEVALEGGSVELACERTSRGAVRWTIRPRGVPIDSVEHEHRLGFRDETWVLLKAIDATAGDAVYREALFAAADWSAR